MIANTEDKRNNQIPIAVLSMPDGTEYKIPLLTKTFSTGREGFYAQVSSFVYDNDVYGGQIQIWKKSNNKVKST